MLENDTAAAREKIQKLCSTRLAQTGAKHAVQSLQPIYKGWSDDQKFCMETDDGQKFLLRITPEAHNKNREEMFHLQKKAFSLGVPMCRPIDFFQKDGAAYAIYSWIDGQDAEAVIPYLSDTEQYAYGLEAGKILQTIHSIPTSETLPDWEIRFNAKLDYKIALYRKCPIQFEGADAIIDYIESNRHLLQNRPQTFQHGDYHIGNMMIENGKIVIIDFDKYDFGDPWEDLRRIVWCAQVSPLFACGRINGYFTNAVPKDFWNLLALYIGANTFSSVPWAIPFGNDQVQIMLQQAKDVLSWYDHMKNPIPSWYFEGYYLQYIDGHP